MDTGDTTSGRSRRVKRDKYGRNEAFEKLKQLKGSKNKYEMIEEKPLFDEVSEKEYSKIVKKRQEDDWIIDDNGMGYVEDGREVFEDNLDATDGDIHARKPTKEKAKKTSLVPEKGSTKKFADIKSMLISQPVKRKTQDVNLEEDEVFQEMLKELQSSSPATYSSHNYVVPKPMVLHKKPRQNTEDVFSRPSHISPILRHTYKKPEQKLDTKTSNSFSKPLPKKFDKEETYQHLMKELEDDSKLSETNKPFVPSKKSFTELNQVKKLSQSPIELPKFHNSTGLRRKVLTPKIVNFDQADNVEPMEDDRDDYIPEQILKAEESNNVDEFNLSEMEDIDFSNDFLTPAKETVNTSLETPNKFETSTDLFSFIMNMENGPENVTAQVHIDPCQLPLTALDNGDYVLRFFWFDAYEDGQKHPGTVYLFGKVFLADANVHVSCCIIVKDIQRRFFILPRETHQNTQTKADTNELVTLQDVYLEVNSIASKMKITEFKTKKSTKSYAFDNMDIPEKSDYLEVQYSAKYPTFPSDLSGETFSHVLGTDTSSLEILLLDRKIKGPCWLDIRFPQISNPPLSWCKIEATVSKIQDISVVSSIAPPPPLTVMSLNIATVVNSRNQQNEIIAISALYHDDFPLDKVAPKPHFNAHICALAKPSDSIFPYGFKNIASNCKNLRIDCIDGERALLAFFIAKIQKIDPDVIIGHDMLGFNLDVLLHRFVTHKIPNFSRIGRLRRANASRMNTSGINDRNMLSGRLLCDVKISAKELIRCKSYDLTELSSHILNRKFEEIPMENIRKFYLSSNSLLELVDYVMISADIILSLSCELNILPLALQITNIAGCVMSRTLLGGRSERNEYLLLHAFHEKNYIYPSKANKKPMKNQSNDTEALSKTQGRRKPAYEGGLVLDPKIGFYDKYILLMDFNSLYPSIIQEYNICFTTVERFDNSEKKKQNEEDTIANLPEPGLEPGILPNEIRKLVESRKQVKSLMKSDLPKDKLLQYDIRQKALKLTANSMYGCLGFTHSRFYAKPLAAMVTRKGREILMKTKELVDKMGLDVIYGDTDSIMINTNQDDLDAVMRLGNKVKAEVNKLYRLLEIDIDGVYKPMLLLKKKKYAALSISRLTNGQLSMKEEMKGLDIVRRDWSQLAKNAGEFVIKQILSTKSKDEIIDSIHSHLVALGKDISTGMKPVTDFVILKQLTKHPEQYPDKKNLPHVQVALRINSKGNKKLKQNDTVPYVICTDGTDAPNIQRAYHPEELKTNETLKIDFEYYLSNQVHPVISRLCAPIEGTDAAMIAQLLGLNPAKFASKVREQEEFDDKLLTATSVFDDADRFNSCDGLILKCPGQNCSEQIITDAVFQIDIIPHKLQLSSCTKCNFDLTRSIPALCNQLQLIIRQYVTKYYTRMLFCEDDACGYQTRKIPLIFNSGGPVCPICQKSNLKQKYNESQLYLQLAYFSHLFNIEKAASNLEKKDKDRLKGEKEVSLYKNMKFVVDKFLRHNGYGQVNLGNLFTGLSMQK